MSSIAYVTDQHMIEFHRVMGNQQLIFWRLSSTLRFSDFHQGDLLFFLAKGTERSKTNREKGIIGYGKFTSGEVLTPRLAWRRYKSMNGYNTEEEFYEVLCKASKNKQLPDQISCLHLDNIVFFQAPIYLSELGMEISNNLESYVYLDKEEDTTLKILEKAKDVGVDVWSLTHFEEPSEVFENTQIREIISKVSDFLKEKEDKHERANARFLLKAISKLENDYSEIDLIKGNPCEACQIIDHNVSIFLPILFTNKTKMDAIIKGIGKLTSYKSLLELDPYVDMHVDLYALFDGVLEEGLVNWIENCDVHCIMIESK